MSLHLADGLDSGVSLDMPFIPERLVYISDCINGIICLRELSSRLFLWNPAIREYKVIPDPPSYVHSPSNVCYDYPTFAFGYDHIFNDYKLVQIGTYSTVLYDLIDQILHPVVHIYNLSTNSWRQINTGVDHSIICFPGECSNEIFLNGVYHWPGCIILDEHGRDCEVIVCFDMRDEVFRIINMPNLGDISHIKEIWKTVALLNDCVALIIYDLKQRKHCDI
ncbi:F-box/kelch-repeat protein At3g06240-like [Castanea sativa]|uniref:F-box/kelch-repeat protein At3g06240-like n=1 Tax=Castanea sativa TaxID=21020 RepID=UPI003F6549FE